MGYWIPVCLGWMLGWLGVFHRHGCRGHGCHRRAYIMGPKGPGAHFAGPGPPTLNQSWSYGCPKRSVFEPHASEFLVPPPFKYAAKKNQIISNGILSRGAWVWTEGGSHAHVFDSNCRKSASSLRLVHRGSIQSHPTLPRSGAANG